MNQFYGVRKTELFSVGDQPALPEGKRPLRIYTVT